MLEEIKIEMKKQGIEKGIKMSGRKLHDASVAVLTSLTDKSKKSYGLPVNEAVANYYKIAYKK